MGGGDNHGTSDEADRKNEERKEKKGVYPRHQES